MKIILLQDVRGLGKKWDVKDVSPGYAMNALVPKGLAKAATDAEVRKLQTEKAREEKQREETRQKLEVAAENLKNTELRFYVKTGERGEVFGSVSEKEIIAGLKKEGVIAQKINLPKPLRTLGEHIIEVSLGMGVAARIKIVLLPKPNEKP